MGNGKILGFSSIEHFFCSFAIKYMFICTITIFWANGKILDFSSIEHFFVYLH